LPLILRESEIFFFSSLNLFIWNLGSSTSFLFIYLIFIYLFFIIIIFIIIIIILL
jgi:hypothetical protein